MSTKAGTIGFSGRPVPLRLWTAAVSALAAAALIMSAVALNVATRSDGSATVAGNGAAESVQIEGFTPWDAGKLEAMKGLALAESVRIEGFTPWDAGKLEAMKGRALAESVRVEGFTPWDAGKLEAMKGLALAG
jgi:hypothetical protein